MKFPYAALFVLAMILLQSAKATAQTPTPLPTPAVPPPSTSICTGTSYAGGQTVPFGPLQVVLPPAGNFTVDLNIPDPLGQSIDVCYVEGNSSIVFNTSGVERSRTVTNLAASAVLNQVKVLVFLPPPGTRPMPTYADTGVKYVAMILDRNGQPARDGARVWISTAGSIRPPGTPPQVCLETTVLNGRIEFTTLTPACPEVILGPIGAVLELLDGQAPITARADELFEWRRAYVGEGTRTITIRPVPPPTAGPPDRAIRPPATGSGGLREP